MKSVKRATEPYINKTYGEKADAIRRAVASYMKGCPVLWAMPSLPNSNAPSSDGEYYWFSGTEDKIASGEIEPDEEFVAHVIRQKTPPTELANGTLEAFMEQMDKEDAKNKIEGNKRSSINYSITEQGIKDFGIVGTPEELKAIADKLNEILSNRIGLEIVGHLTDQQVKEFNASAGQGQVARFEILQKIYPEYEQIVIKHKEDLYKAINASEDKKAFINNLDK
jgi:hypothetical protein